jgi:hypothetical protein
MRRILALLVVIVLAALSVGPAAACGERTKKSCCCDRAPIASLCARSCCSAPPATHAVELSVDLVSIALPSAATAIVACVPTPARVESIASTASLVGLHERAAPRLPLRV